jgi:hypothetical protein
VDKSVAGRRAILLASGFWLKRLLANQTFFGFQRPRHSGNRASDVGSALVIDITALLTAKNVALSPRLKHLTAFDTWSWLDNYRLFIVLVIATSATKPLIPTSGQKQLAATFTGNLDFRLSDFVAVSSSVLFFQFIATTVATSLVAARLAIKFLAANHTLRLCMLGLQLVKTNLSASPFLAFGQKLQAAIRAGSNRQ